MVKELKRSANLFKFNPLACLVFGLLFFYSTSQAYLLPSRQILEMLAKNLPNASTMFVAQSIFGKDRGPSSGPASVKQRVWVKLPDFFYCERTSSLPPYTQPHGSETIEGCGNCSLPEYLQLFLQHTEQGLTTLLTHWGIITDHVGLILQEKRVCYRIGQKGPHDPVLVIDREHFLPKVLRYIKTGDNPGLVTLQFQNYKKLSEGWFPSEVVCTDTDGNKEIHIVEEVKINLNISPLDFPGQENKPAIPGSISPLPKNVPQEDRIREIIKILKKEHE